MDDQKYKVLLREIRKIQSKQDSMSEDVNRIDRDMADDRQAIEAMQTNQETINSKQTSIINMITSLRIKLKDAVSDATFEVMSPVKEQLDQFVEKKFIKVNPIKEKWYSKFGFLKIR